MTFTPTPTPLSFPPSTHAKLSPRTYLTAHLSSSSTDPLRPSSRSSTTSRTPLIHTRNLTHTHGSAVIRLGDTAVVCGIQGSVLLASNIPSNVSLPASPSPSTPQNEKQKRRDDRQAMAELGLLVPNIELNTGCAPEYLPGGPPGVVSQTLVQRVVTALAGCDVVEFERLKLYGRTLEPAGSATSSEGTSSDEDVDMDAGGGVPLDPTSIPVARQPESEGPGEGPGGERGVQGYYTLSLHVYVLSLDHGANGLFDAVWMAVMAALVTTRLPEVWVGDDGESVNVDWERPMRKVCGEGGWPVASSFGVFRMRRDGHGGAKKGEEEGERGKEEGSVILADPDAFEEGLCEEVVTLLVRKEEGQVRILGMEKQGGGVVGLDEMRNLAVLAGDRFKRINKVLEQECRA